jgi:UDP-N-acetylglucosamine/UDP-N-acetylgalactosamine diphosphorylase
VRQGELPAVDDAGRALLAGPGRLALAPDGHGGLLDALHRGGALAWLAGRGVEVLTTAQVDNPLARPLDPVFLGWLAERRAVAGGKAVRRRDPGERVGVFARGVDGRLRVVEYSELPPDGAPDLTMGNIAVHAFSLPWLSSLVADPGFALPFHRARKRVACLGTDGRVEEPAAPNATKLEQFLFDLLPLAPRAVVHEAVRAREFAPVKNAEGEDSPATARALVAAEVARWHRAAGRAVPDPVPALRPLEADGPEDLGGAGRGGDGPGS